VTTVGLKEVIGGLRSTNEKQRIEMARRTRAVINLAAHLQQHGCAECEELVRAALPQKGHSPPNE
jgi:hypothetical protein